MRKMKRKTMEVPLILRISIKILIFQKTPATNAQNATIIIRHQVP